MRLSAQQMAQNAANSIAMGGTVTASTVEQLKDHAKNWREGFARRAIIDGGRRLDVNETALFLRQLEAVHEMFFDKKYPTLMAKDFIPMKTNIPAGAETIAAYGFDWTGSAQVLAGYGEDVPLVDLHAKRMVTPLVGLAAGFVITLQQIRAAAMSGMPISEKGMLGARRVVEQKEDELLALGDTTLNLQGLLSVTGATTGNLTTGGWATATAAQIQQDVIDVITDMKSATSNVFFPNVCLLPTDTWVALLKPMFADSGPTIKDFLQSAFSGYGLTFHEFWRCDGAGAAGADRACFFYKDEEVVEGYTSIAPEMLPPEYHSLYYTNIVHMRTGGVNSANPLGVRYADNV
jgi:hypothetical protein